MAPIGRTFWQGPLAVHGGSGRGIGRAGGRAEGGPRRSGCDRARRRPDDSVEGTAGIGKSALLGAIGRRAGEAGFRGPCRPRQRARDRLRIRRRSTALRGGGRRRRHRSGSGRLRGPAGILFEAAADDAAPGGNVSFSVLHGLFWMTLNLAGDEPMLLVVDDLQWCDRSSLRFLAYLAHRLDGTSIGLVTAQRTNEPGVDPALTAGISSEPSSVAIHPRPLSKAGIGELVERQFERRGTRSSASPASGHRTQPLLLQQTLNALALEGRSPTAGEAERSPISGRGRCRGPSRPVWPGSAPRHGRSPARSRSWATAATL